MNYSLQHIIASLSESGRAAVVVPTGFTTAAKGISKVIRQRIIEKNWLRGVLHMPSHIFAMTATSVSIIFIDKAKANDTVLLMDASKWEANIPLEMDEKQLYILKKRVKLHPILQTTSKNQNSPSLVSNQDILENDCSILAGQYVELKEEEIDFEIDERLAQVTSSLVQNLRESQRISASLLKIRGVILKDFRLTKCVLKTFRIDALCTVKSSKRVYARDYVPNGVPFFRGREITQMSQNKPISKNLYISKDVFEEMDKKFGSPKIGDIL